jgi:ABC-type transport system involved in multi-copper enzyme maturation permease subunit
MVWHIFKKDLRLRWPYGLTAAIAQVAIITVHLKLGVFEKQRIFAAVLLVLEIMMDLGVAVLIATVVHEDSVVGVRQDWLVRPIRRRDLVAAKLLFLLLTMQVPMLLACVIGGLANGFPFWLSLSAALSQNVYFLIGFTLPIFAFVSLTGSTSEALGVAFMIVVGSIMGLNVLVLPITGSPLGPTSNTGLAWIPLTFRFAIYFVAALAILVLQYFRRATRASWRLLAASVATCLFSALVPWKVVFALQKAIAPAPIETKAIAVSFSPGHLQSATEASLARNPAIAKGDQNQEMNEDTILHIPLLFIGVPGGSILKIDRTVARLTVPNTAREEIVSAMGDADDFEVPDDDQHTSEPRPIDEILHVRGNVYTQIKDAPVTLQLEYSVTLLKLSSTHTIPAVNGDVFIDDLGHCKTRLNDSRTEVDLNCLDVGNTSQCTTALLQDPATGLHNPPLHGCRDDYAPYFGRYQPPDTLVLRGVDFDFRDPSGLIHYPVNESTVNGAHVLIKNYNVAGHFTMHLTIPAIRLAEWSAR